MSLRQLLHVSHLPKLLKNSSETEGKRERERAREERERKRELQNEKENKRRRERKKEKEREIEPEKKIDTIPLNQEPLYSFFSKIEHREEFPLLLRKYLFCAHEYKEVAREPST